MKKKQKTPVRMAKKVRTSRASARQWVMFIFSVFVVSFISFGVIYFNSHRPAPCANAVSCINNLSGAYEPDSKGIWMGKQVTAPQYQSESGNTTVLGATSVQKLITIDLGTQHLYAYEDNKVVMDFPISSGKWTETPTGDFHIWIKLRYTHITGGSETTGTYYDLPNAQYVMFFYNEQHPKSAGYEMNGAYWQNRFGYPTTYGSINLSDQDAKRLYDWADPPTLSTATYATDANPGTPVHIYGTTPKK